MKHDNLRKTVEANRTFFRPAATLIAVLHSPAVPRVARLLLEVAASKRAEHPVVVALARAAVLRPAGSPRVAVLRPVGSSRVVVSRPVESLRVALRRLAAARAPAESAPQAAQPQAAQPTPRAVRPLVASRQAAQRQSVVPRLRLANRPPAVRPLAVLPQPWAVRPPAGLTPRAAPLLAAGPAQRVAQPPATRRTPVPTALRLPLQCSRRRIPNCPIPSPCTTGPASAPRRNGNAAETKSRRTSRNTKLAPSRSRQRSQPPFPAAR